MLSDAHSNHITIKRMNIITDQKTMNWLGRIYYRSKPPSLTVTVEITSHSNVLIPKILGTIPEFLNSF